MSNKLLNLYLYEFLLNYLATISMAVLFILLNKVISKNFPAKKPAIVFAELFS